MVKVSCPVNILLSVNKYQLYECFFKDGFPTLGRLITSDKNYFSIHEGTFQNSFLYNMLGRLWLENQNLSIEGNFVQGKPNGQCETKVYEDKCFKGDTLATMTGLYQNWKPDGVHKITDERGKIRRVYVNGFNKDRIKLKLKVYQKKSKNDQIGDWKR